MELGRLYRTAMRHAGAVASLAALASVACTDSTTSLAAPTTVRCQLVLATSVSSFAHSGGSGRLIVSADRDCTWTMSAEPGWIVLDARTGQGDATVAYTVGANPAPTPRSGAIVAGSERIELRQEPAPCRYELKKNDEVIDAAGGQMSVELVTLTGCRWTAVSQEPWISVRSGASGSASGSVGLAVAPNTGPSRAGRVLVGGETFRVTQRAAGAPAPPGPAPEPPPPPPPPPEPAPGKQVDVKGNVSNLSGTCPNVAFDAGGRRIVVNLDTDFRHRARCSDLSNGDRVDVRGIVQAGGAVLATRIDIKNDKDDSDDEEDD